MLPDAVSEIPSRRAEEIHGKNNQLLNSETKHPPIWGRGEEGIGLRRESAAVLKKQ